MKTASFWAKIDENKQIKISIARYQPHGMAHPREARLAPGPWFNRVNEPEYRRLFAEQLSVLDIWDVLASLRAMSSDKEVVLCCWEPSGKFCHRRLVAEWFARLGFDVDEITPDAGTLFRQERGGDGA